MKDKLKQTYVIAGVLLFVGIGLCLAIGLGLGLRGQAPRDDTNIAFPPGLVDDKMTTTTAPKKTMTDPKHMSPHEKYRLAAVQTDTFECSKIGMDVMLGYKEASAVDAAIATLLCLGTINVHGCGLGGGHFMTLYDSSSGEVHTRLSREVLPLAGHKDFFKNVSSLKGGKAIGVPGELKGLYSAWEIYGKVPWAKLVDPAINLAENGFVVTRNLAEAIIIREEGIREDPNLKAMFIKPDGSFVKEGEILKRPKFAETLKIVARDPESFYSGTLGDEVVADIQERDGVIIKQDLLNYQTKDVNPIVGRLDKLNITMYSPPPPSSGVILQFILRILDGYKFNASSINATDSAILTYHRVIEAWKFAYARRSSLGDASFWNVAPVLANLTDEAFIDATRRKIDDTKTHSTSYYEPDFEQRHDSGTTHFNVLAPDGSAVAITATINTRFGALVMGTRTGIVFNNELDDFSTPGKVNFFGYEPSPSNYGEPGKMPMSSMSPSIFLNSDRKVVFMGGASGGSTIISSTSFVALHNLYLGLNLWDAVSHPRIHHQLLPEKGRYEEAWNPDIIDGLVAKGHKLGRVAKDISTVGSIRNRCVPCIQGPACNLQCINAVSDWRKMGGKPYGY